MKKKQVWFLDLSSVKTNSLTQDFHRFKWCGQTAMRTGHHRLTSPDVHIYRQIWTCLSFANYLKNSGLNNNHFSRTLVFFFRLRIQEGHSLEVPELNFIRHQSVVSFGIWLVFTHKFSTFLGELVRMSIYGSFFSMKTFHVICPLKVRLHKQQLRIPRTSPMRAP